MYCSHCGNKMNKEQDVCLNCGESKVARNRSNKESIVYQIIFFVCIITTLIGAFGCINNIRILLFSYYADFSNIINIGVCFTMFMIGLIGCIVSKKRLNHR